MLDLNITFVIQMINFFVTWFCFDRLILRDAFKTVIHEEHSELALRKDQQQAQEYLDDQMVALQDERAKANRQLFGILPQQISGLIPIRKTTGLKTPALTPQTQQEVKRRLVDSILENIKNSQGAS